MTFSTISFVYSPFICQWCQACLSHHVDQESLIAQPSSRRFAQQFDSMPQAKAGIVNIVAQSLIADVPMSQIRASLRGNKATGNKTPIGSSQYAKPMRHQTNAWPSPRAQSPSNPKLLSKTDIS